MSILIALIPALAWGSVGLVNTKMGGTAAQQTLGMTFGALLFGLATMFFYVIPNGIVLDSKIWLVGFISGLFWAVGTAGQFTAFKALGVSIGMPLSSAGQIITNALMAAIVLGEWQTMNKWLFGLLSIILVVVGATLISARDKQEQSDSNLNTKGIFALIYSTIGFMLYFVFPNLMVQVGYIAQSVKEAVRGVDYMTAVVGPQALGQVLGAFLIVIFIYREAHHMFAAPTWRNILTGLVWAIGNLFMFISAANPDVGQAVATTLSQMGIVVGTLGGIYLLKEKKTSYQMKMIYVGIVFVVAGALLINNLPA
jgi:glucose uptake protein